MAYTISYRMDSTASQPHNTRELLTRELAHPERTEENITLWNIDCREAYPILFDRGIEEYNSRQKRPDRQIKYDGRGYYDKILNTSFNKTTKQGNKQGQQHPYYEVVVQVGDKDNHPDEQTLIQIYKDYVARWQDKNKNLHLVGAYIHLDEATPHLHIDYVPVAEMKKGMRFQNGLNKAFEQLMGYQSQNAHDTAQQQFQSREREVLRDICREYAIEIEETKHNDRKHLTVEQFKEQKIADEMEILRAIEETDISDAGKQTILQRLTKSEYTTIKTAELELLKQQAQAGQGKERVIQDLQEQLKDTKAENAKFRQGIAREQQSNRDRKQYLDSRQQELNTNIQHYNELIKGTAFQTEYEKYKGMTAQVRELRSEIKELKQERATLAERVKELKEFLSENIRAKFERLFIKRHQTEYNEFEKEQERLERNRGFSR